MAFCLFLGIAPADKQWQVIENLSDGKECERKPALCPPTARHYGVLGETLQTVSKGGHQLMQHLSGHNLLIQKADDIARHAGGNERPFAHSFNALRKYQ